MDRPLSFPAPTGTVCRFLGVPQDRVQDAIRRCRLWPVPPILAGRRLWGADDLRRLARAIKKLTPEIEAAIDAAESASSGATR